jgi:hypothetical protein
MRKVSSALISAILLVSTTGAITPAQAAVTLPTGSFAPCAVAPGDYCIDSVSVAANGGKPITLNWQASGSVTAPVAAADANVVPGKSLPGIWSSDLWSKSRLGAGYSGLYLDIHPANQFVPWIFATALPVLNQSGQAVLAAQSSNANYAMDLDENVEIIYKLKVANFQTGVTFGVGTDGAISASASGGSNYLQLSGYPVRVPMAAASKDCVGDTGKASAIVRSFESVIVPQNDQMGFGLPGSTGNLYIGSNGLCKLSTPVWNADTKVFQYSANAPKLAPDGVTTNTGFYHAVIPISDAVALWGLKNPNDAASALLVSITTTAGGSVTASKSVSVRGGNIIIDVSGFNFPDPLLDVRLNADYNSSTDGLATLVSTPTPTPTPSPVIKTPLAKKLTITCVKGIISKRVTAIKPLCPAGYKKK